MSPDLLITLMMMMMMMMMMILGFRAPQQCCYMAPIDYADVPKRAMNTVYALYFNQQNPAKLSQVMP